MQISKPAPLPLSVGRHQARRIMCNYNGQSKTKPFTFNELHSEGKGRLPQGGILMKQMAECSQGLTLPVLPFFFFFYSLPTFSAFWGASPVSSALFVRGVRTILSISTLERKELGNTRPTNSVLRWSPHLFRFHYLQLCANSAINQENIHGRRAFCMFNPIFYFIQYVCLLTMQFFLLIFFLPSFICHIHTRSISHDYCRSVCGCWVVQRNVPRVHVQPRHTCADPLLLFFAPPPAGPVFNAEKIDIHWSIAKWSKYSPHQKGCESSEQELNQSLNIKVELSGRKSIIKKKKQKKEKEMLLLQTP